MMFRVERLSRWLRDIIPLIMWMILIFFFSAQSVLIDIQNETDEKIFYKTAHMLVYAVLAWLWWRVLAPRRQLTWPVLWAAVALTLLFAISDEIHQLFVPGRNGRLADIFFDMGGALAMILLIRRIKWLRTFPDSLSFPVIRKLGGES
jgi:VanZ family protein